MGTFLLKMLGMVIRMMSPELKSYIQSQLPEWRQKANETTNQWDDLLVDFLEGMFA